jgi:hypothetical protein
MNQLFLFWRIDDFFGTGEAIGSCDDEVCKVGLALDVSRAAVV